MMKHLMLIILCFLFPIPVISQINIEMANRAAELNNKASKLLNAGQYLEAETHLIKAIEYDSTLRSAYINLHESYTKQNKLDSAITNLDKAVSVFTDDDELWYYLGNTYNKADHFEEAIAAYSMAIEYSKQNEEEFPFLWAYYFNKANCLAELKRHAKAIPLYTKALKFQPNNSYIYFNRGMSYLMVQNKDSAKTDWEEAVKLGMEIAIQYLEKYCR